MTGGNSKMSQVVTALRTRLGPLEGFEAQTNKQLLKAEAKGARVRLESRALPRTRAWGCTAAPWLVIEFGLKVAESWGAVGWSDELGVESWAPELEEIGRWVGLRVKDEEIGWSAVDSDGVIGSDVLVKRSMAQGSRVWGETERWDQVSLISDVMEWIDWSESIEVTHSFQLEKQPPTDADWRLWWSCWE